MVRLFNRMFPIAAGIHGPKMQDASSVSTSVPPAFKVGKGMGLARLRILATSDLHAHVTPWDYLANRASPATGLARTASLIARARAEVGCCLLVDNGDFLQGSPMGDVEALKARGSGGQHPMIAAMNALGYDAATLGNHEFSHGVAFLTDHLAAAEFPVVASNLVRRLGASVAEDEPLVLPRLLLRRMLRDRAGVEWPLTIGIVGFAPPQTTQWDNAKLGNAVQARDILEAAAHHVARLREDGAELVLALSHSGIGAETARPWMENASAALAALPGIDALVAGHTHQTFPAPDFSGSAAVDPVAGTLWGKPAVMPGFHGSHLGLIDLDLRWEGRWRVTGGQSSLRPIAERMPSGRLRARTRSAPAILDLAEPAHRATRAWARRVVGHSRRPLHSYFAMVSATPAVRLIARAQAAHVAGILAGGPHADLPVLSVAAPFHCGGRGGPENYTHVEAGRLTMRHVFDLYPHPNRVAALLVTGAELRAWLERSFSQFRQVTPGAQDQDLLNPDFPSFNFDMIEGLTWEVDLCAPGRHDNRGEVVCPDAARIRDLSWQGRPLAPDQRFVLATNSYRVNGSGGFAAARPDRQILHDLRASRDVLMDHIAAGREIAPPEPPNWRFRPMPGTTVCFYSAPEAAAHLDELAPLRAEPLGMTAQGFRRFRLHL